MKALAISVVILISISVNGQELVMSQLGPKTADDSEIIREFKTFIIYKDDTLNQLDPLGLRVGNWIEYRKAYVQSTSGKLTTTDSTKAMYVLERKGLYVDGKKTGRWDSFYRDVRIKESKVYD